MYKAPQKRLSYVLTCSGLLLFFQRVLRGEVATFYPVYSVSQDVLKIRFICLQIGHINFHLNGFTSTEPSEIESIGKVEINR